MPHLPLYGKLNVVILLTTLLHSTYSPLSIIHLDFIIPVKFHEMYISGYYKFKQFNSLVPQWSWCLNSNYCVKRRDLNLWHCRRIREGTVHGADTEGFKHLTFLFRLTFQILLVTWCSSRFNIKKFYILPTLYLYVLYLSQNKQQLSSYTRRAE
jgi:hypothetical protein